jgi:ATP-binding cassette subfamily C protein
LSSAFREIPPCRAAPRRAAPLRFPPAPAASIVASALSSCRGAFAAVGLFSGVINLLMLSGSFYMLQVYDRVLSSRSVPTAVGP